MRDPFSPKYKYTYTEEEFIMHCKGHDPEKNDYGPFVNSIYVS